MQCLAKSPSALATYGVVCTTFGGVTETPILILRIAGQFGCAAAAPGHPAAIAHDGQRR